MIPAWLLYAPVAAVVHAFVPLRLVHVELWPAWGWEYKVKPGARHPRILLFPVFFSSMG